MCALLEQRLKGTLRVLLESGCKVTCFSQRMDKRSFSDTARTDNGDEFSHICIVLRELF